MKSGPNHTIRLFLTLILVACAAGFATRREFYSEALVDAFFGLTLASLTILLLRVRPRWSDLLFVWLCTATLAIVDFRILHFPSRPMAWFSFLGVSSLLVLGLRAVWAKDGERKLLLYAWIPAVLFIASEWFATDMLGWISSAHPKTLDLYLLSFDASLHVQLSFLAGQAFAAWPWLRLAGLLFYIGLAIPIAVVYGGRLARFGSRAFPAMLAFLITGPLGILYYYLFPACGPVHAAHQFFPFHPLGIEQTRQLLLEPIAIEGPRNAIPSLHLAWALLAWWYSRGLNWWERAIAFTFLAFTIIATLGTGEHYVVDLVVAFPFALMIRAACSYELSWKDSPRLSAVLFGLGATLAWLAALRYGNALFWISPVVAWALLIATIALVTLRHREVEQAVGAAEKTSDQAAKPQMDSVSGFAAASS